MDARPLSTTRLTRRYARWLTAKAVVDRAGPGLVAVAVGCGGVALLLRREGHPPSAHLPALVGGAGVLLAGFLAGLWRRHRCPLAEAAVVVDRQLRAHGLYLTLAECPDPRWSTYLRWRGDSVAPPRPSWGRLGWPAILGAAFLTAALLVPVGGGEPLPQVGVGRRLLGDLEAQTDQLAQAGLLDSEAAVSVREELRELRASVEARGLTAREWEAVDALRRRLEAATTETLQEISLTSQLLGAAGNAGGLDLAGLAPLLPSALQTLRFASRVGLTPTDLLELRKAAESGAIDPILAQRLAALAPQLREFLDSKDLEKLARDAGVPEALVRELRNRARAGGGGRNGTDGGASAPPRFGGETRLHRERFTPGTLPSGSEPGAPLGVTVEAPEVSPDPTIDVRSPREFERTESERTARGRWRPVHRGLIRRYFAPEAEQPRD